MNKEETQKFARSYLPGVDALLFDDPWTPWHRINGKSIKLLQCTSDEVAAALRVIYMDYGWDLIATRNGGENGYTAEYHLIFKYPTAAFGTSLEFPLRQVPARA